MKYFIFFLLSLHSLVFSQQVPLSSTPEEINALTSDTDSLIGGIISPLSGQVVLSKLDLVVQGAQSISMGRVYIPAMFSAMPPRPPALPKDASKKTREKQYSKEVAHYLHIETPWWTDLVGKSRGWVFLPHLHLAQINESTFRVPLSNGSVLDFSKTSSGFQLTTSSYGISNAAGDTPDPLQDIRNIRLELINDKLVLHASDGTRAIYAADDPKRYKKCHGILNEWILTKEILPSGKILRYHYGDFSKEKFFLRPKIVESLDPTETHIYASVTIDGSTQDRKCNYSDEAKISVNYDLEPRKQEISCVFYSHGEPVLDKTTFTFSPRITSAGSPFYRTESISYNDHNQMTSIRDRNGDFSFSYEGSPYLITKLFRPCGEKCEMLPLYTIAYDSPIAGVKGGVTTATRIDGSKIIYRFDAKLLLSSIEWICPKGVKKKEKIYSWDTDQKLKGISIKDEEGIYVFQKEFDYDDFQNVKTEVIRGDLTGTGVEDVYVTRRTYSQDCKHLLLKEENEEGVAVVFTYLRDTNLPETKLTYVHEKLEIEECWEYDGYNNLILHWSDQGGIKVGQRYQLRQEKPFLHMPDWIEDVYWEKGEEKTLKRTHLEYDKRGNVFAESLYGSDGQFAYRTERKYDAQGNVRSETNPLGEISTASYDAKGYNIDSVNKSKRLSKLKKYDVQGRMYYAEETGDQTITHITKYDYNRLDQCFKETDYFDNVTTYEYDPIVSKPTKIISPPILISDGQSAEVITSVIYDCLGRETSRTNPNGYTTTTQYNFYSKPTLITHPDDHFEKFVYFLNGHLKTATDSEGHTTEYTYTPLNQLESKTRRSSTGDICEIETYRYEGLQLRSSTDKGGHVTDYFYDAAGRKSSEKTDGRITEFKHDALSRLIETKTLNGEQTLVSITKYDLLNRVVEERAENLSGQILYQIFYNYDADNNKSVITRWGKENLVKELFTYDPFQRLVSQENALGKISTTEYTEDVRNRLNQRVLTKIYTDPMGLQTIDIYDARGQIASTEKKSDQTLNLEQFYRDPCGQLLDQISTIYREDSTRIVNTHWEYNSRQRLELLIEAYGSAKEKRTYSTYTPNGHLFETTKPDGVVITRTYDPLSRLKTIVSSDDTISYAYTYTPDGEISELKDLKTGKSTSRSYDKQGRLKQETLANGLIFKTTEYDNCDRRGLFVLPDNSSIRYDYDPMRLRTVSRLNDSKKLLYNHTYLKHDLSGHLLEEQMIGKLGKIESDYDLLARQIYQSSPVATYEVREYDDANNILELTTTDSTGSDTSVYSYDKLSQIISETGLFNNVYDFDSHNNRLKKNDAEYQINDLNQLLATDRDIFEYNLNGDPISKNNGEVTYAYDALDRLTEITIKDSKKLTFTYDGLHRRLSKTVYAWESSWRNFWELGWLKQNHELFLFDGQNEIGSADENGYTRELRILGEASHAEIGAAIAMELNGTVYTPLHDLHGNVAYLVKTSHNTISAAYRYSAFGEEKLTITPEVQNCWRFSSKRVDEESGLIYYGRRYYNPEVGRWLTPDPAGFTDGMNLYAFVHNDPLTHFDEYGLFDYGQSIGNSTNQYQGQLGLGYGITNSLFNAAWLGNTLLHAPLAPLYSFDFKNLSFNASMPPSFHSANSWLDRQHERVNNRLFSNADFSNDSFRKGSMGGQFLGDQIFGGLPGRALGSVMAGVGKISGLGTYLSGYQSVFKNNNAFRFFWNNDKKAEALNYTKSNLRLGQRVHKSYKSGEVALDLKAKEYYLPSKKRIDFLDIPKSIQKLVCRRD